MTKEQLKIKAVKAYETAIEMANERENYKAFIEYYGEGNAFCQVIETMFDLWVARDDGCKYIAELQEFCGDIYSMIDATFTKK